MAHVARRLDEDGILREDVTVEQAEDVLWMLLKLREFRRPLHRTAAVR